ncbi:MAG: M23 family metallopeptidase [candidate division Zixibacteria bacterium]|nr:M23 family metallopeptidase [candidate division Zixibacteria bacterium]
MSKISQVKYYSLMIIPDGVGASRGIKVKAWQLKAIIVIFVALIIALLFLSIFYARILTRATAAEKLIKENEALKKYKYKLGLLEANMKEAHAVVDRIAALAGVDFQMPELPSDSVLFANIDNQSASDIMGRFDSTFQGRPMGVPLRGFMTRGYSDDISNTHPGIDIAVAIGTPVLATAAGKVIFAGFDPTYGLTVIIEHPNFISTLYGHNSELLVKKGDEVTAGERLALSGNTGKSTAPHLHYEIRENGKSINPLKYIGDYEIPNK